MIASPRESGGEIYLGSINPAANVWKPDGMGETAIIKTHGTNGLLKVGFWRTHANALRCRPDGSCLAAGNAPLHDAVLVLEGSGTLTIPASGRVIPIEPGLIVSHPQGIETRWDVDAPYLRKLFVEWEDVGTPRDVQDVYVGHVSDNPDSWRVCKWSEQSAGEQEFGESYVIRQECAPDFVIVGIWRGGVGIGRTCLGGSGVSYSNEQGDTTLLLLEGMANVRDVETGKVHVFKSGDIMGMPEGMEIEWQNLTPFVKAFFVVRK